MQKIFLDKGFRPGYLKEKTPAEFGGKEGTMFDLKKMTQDMIHMQKMAYEQSYHAMTLWQDQMARLGQMCWVQWGAYPEEMKKGVSEWQTAYRKQCEQVKTMVDNGFKHLEALWV